MPGTVILLNVEAAKVEEVVKAKSLKYTLRVAVSLQAIQSEHQMPEQVIQWMLNPEKRQELAKFKTRSNRPSMMGTLVRVRQ